MSVTGWSLVRFVHVLAAMGWVGGLVVSGVALAWRRGVTFGSLDDAGYGRLLSIKLILVAASIMLAAVRGIIASKRPQRARPLALGGLVSSVGIVVLATALVP